MLRMKVKEKQAAQRQIDIDTDSFKLKDQEEKLQAGRYIVELVSAVLAGREPDAKPEDLPVKAIYRMARLHNLDCIVYDGMKRIAGEADADLMEEWANRNTICAAQGIMQQREAKKLVKELPARGIRVLPLKGSILKEFYPQARYRQMADVDILIDRKNMEKAHTVMKELGYQYKGGDSEDTVDKYYKPPCVSIEIHSHLMHYHAENHKKYLDIWERCKEENGVYHMNWDDYYLFLMEHFAKHFNESGSGIRFVLDIYIFLEAKKKELHPEYLKKKQKELGLEEFCREMEEIAYRWFDGRPEIRDSKYETVILLAGIFGIRQWAYAGQQKKYLEKYKNPGIAKGMYLLCRLFPDYHAMAAQYPCRQIAAAHPKKLIIFDMYENNAYEIQQELLRKYGKSLDLEVLIGSVRNTNRIRWIMQKYRPDVVFHAAAHKHVPLMEDSPNEAIKNNVMGTYKTAIAASRAGVKKFVLISTDKAVNPTNIMGASKRLCEMVVQMMNRQSENTDFVAVRFGNVLGSNGSVIPLFKKQIAEGGPVTVTDKNIIRYFMTIPEAVSLVLQAAHYAKGGEIFILDMGEPVRIDEMARNLIRLSGFTPDVDIKVEYTGLRPGEKLFEELLMAEEGMQETPNKLIHIGKPIEMDDAAFKKKLRQLDEAAYQETDRMRKLVAEVVPTYHPENAGNA